MPLNDQADRIQLHSQAINLTRRFSAMNEPFLCYLMGMVAQAMNDSMVPAAMPGQLRSHVMEIKTGEPER